MDHQLLAHLLQVPIPILIVPILLRRPDPGESRTGFDDLAFAVDVGAAKETLSAPGLEDWERRVVEHPGEARRRGGIRRPGWDVGGHHHGSETMKRR